MSEGRLSIDILAVDFAGKGHAVAVIGQEGVFQEVKFLEIEGVAHPNRGAVIAVAPHVRIAVFDPADARIVAYR